MKLKEFFGICEELITVGWKARWEGYICPQSQRELIRLSPPGLKESSIHSNEWIRNEWRPKLVCPITAVYEYLTGKHVRISEARAAGQALGLPEFEIQAIISAADTSSTKFQNIRNELLRVFKLTPPLS